MADWDRYRDRLSIIAHEWNKAEQDIKLAEQIGNKVIIPSISELRYGGRRLIEAIEKSTMMDQMTKSTAFCKMQNMIATALATIRSMQQHQQLVLT